MKNKRVLIVSQYFYPENFRITDYAQYLVKEGVHVDVLTGIPNYPDGKYYSGYGVFKKRKEVFNGINIFRAFQFSRGGKEPSGIHLSLNYLSFAFCASIDALFLALFRKKYDSILVFAPSPITQAIPAIVWGKIAKSPVFVWVQDVWPDAVISKRGSVKKHKFVMNILSGMTEWIYKKSHGILVSSEGMKPLINRIHDFSNKVTYVPNWCDDILAMPIIEVSQLPGEYKIIMAGNLAQGIGVETVVNLVESLKENKELVFVFIGGGALEDVMREEFRKRECHNVVMTGRVPFSAIPAYYAQADAMLLTLKASELPHLKATVPSRFQSYLSSGKPVLAMIDGDSQEIINKNDCGYAVNAGEYSLLSDYIKNEVLEDPEKFAAKGKNSRILYEKQFMLELVCKQLTQTILV